MKTINERIYDFVLNSEKPVTVVSIASQKEFKDVPAMVIGNGLLTICREGLIHYYAKDGIMYFTSDLSIGRGAVGSQGFISNWTDALSSLLNGKKNMSSILSSGVKAFPKEGDAEINKSVDKIQFTKTVRCNEFSISVPARPSEIEQNADGTHDIVAMYKSLPTSSLSVRTQNIDGSHSRSSIKYMTKMMAKTFAGKMFTCTDELEEYSTEEFDAYFVLAFSNSFILLGKPDGILTMLIDWGFEGNLPSKETVYNLVVRWLDTYKYTGEKLWFDFEPINRVTLLQPTLSDELASDILKEFEDQATEVAFKLKAILTSVGTKEESDKITKQLYETRKELEEAAAVIDEFLVQSSDVIRYLEKMSPNSKTLSDAYNISKSVLNLATKIHSDVKVKKNNIPYNSPSDIVIGATTTETINVEVFPEHYMEYLELITTERCNCCSDDSGLKEETEQFYKEMKRLYDSCNKPEVYHPEFKMEGKMIAAYLGDEEKVVIPDNVDAIGPFSFEKATKLKEVIIGENVSSIGFYAFDGCKKLESITVKGDLQSINDSIIGSHNKNLVIHGYKDSNIQKYCKEQGIQFKAIKEKDVDCVINLQEGQYDFYEGFAFPKIEGFKSTSDLSSYQKRLFKKDEKVSHIKYAQVPEDKEFSEYMDVKLSFSVVQNTLEIPQDGLKIADEIEQRFNQSVKYSTYKRTAADGGKVIVRYNITREGEDNGVNWVTYVIFVFKEDKAILMQAFFNGNYTYRQQEYAIKKWANKILLEKTYKDNKKREEKKAEEKRKAEEKQKAEEERKRLEEERLAREKIEKEEYFKALEAWREQCAEIDSQRKKLAEELAQDKQNKLIESNKASTAKLIAKHNQEIEDYQKQVIDAESELSSLGFFAFRRKKELKAKLETLSANITETEKNAKKVRQMSENELEKIKSNYKVFVKKIMIQVEKDNPYPPKPEEPSCIVEERKQEEINKQKAISKLQKALKKKATSESKATKKKVLTKTTDISGMNNYDLRKLIVNTMERDKLYTIDDIRELNDGLKRMSSHWLFALMNPLAREGVLEKIDNRGWTCYKKTHD